MKTHFDMFMRAIHTIGICGTAELMEVNPRTVYYWMGAWQQKRYTFTRSIFHAPALAYAALLDATKANPSGLDLLRSLDEALPHAQEVAALLPACTRHLQQSAFATTLRSLGTQETTARLLGLRLRAVQRWYRISRLGTYPQLVRGLLHTPALAYAALLDAARNNPKGVDTLTTLTVPCAKHVPYLVLYNRFPDDNHENDNHIDIPRDKMSHCNDICAS